MHFSYITGQAPLYKEGADKAEAHQTPATHLPLLALFFLEAPCIGEALPTETLHHMHHVIPSTSPPYLLDQGRRRCLCATHVHISDALFVAALIRLNREEYDYIIQSMRMLPRVVFKGMKI
jgi:hypothetical protein